VNPIIFDIETGPLPEDKMPPFNEETVALGNLKDEAKIKAKIEEAKVKYLDDAALHAHTGQVLAIGYLGDKLAIDARDEKRTERKILLRFWEIFSKSANNSRQMVGHNIFAFDLPFLCRRSFVNSVAVPPAVLEKNRYWCPIFVDIRERWQCGDRQAKSSLHLICTALGLPGKPDDGMTGADFARFFEQDRQVALDYLKNDLEITRAAAVAMGVM